MPKVVDHEAYRCSLLRASFEIAAKVGYGSLSMKQLAQNLKISTGLIYHYFENKEDWFVSLVTYLSSETFERLDREIPMDASLREKTEHLLAHIERHKERYASMISVASDFVRMPQSQEQDIFLELGFAVDRVHEHFATLFETNAVTSRALVSYLVGVIVASRLDPRGIDMGEHLPFIQLLLQSPGILNSRGAP